jgi:hypothetical protein
MYEVQQSEHGGGFSVVSPKGGIVGIYSSIEEAQKIADECNAELNEGDGRED